MRHGSIRFAVFLAAAFLGLAHPCLAQLQAIEVASGLSQPLAFVQDPSDPTVQVIVEQGGHVRVLKDGALQGTDFLDLSGVTTGIGEQGLLGLAFAPDYATSGRVFVDFINADGNIVIARFRRSASDPLQADGASRFDLVWPGGQPFIAKFSANHNGGGLAFGPDGYLYLGLGDSGWGNDPYLVAQSLASLLGKILRVNVNVPDEDAEGYDVPPDNPFVGREDALGEIWALGLRNPWRWSFDGGTGALVIADVGQDHWEEIDYQPAGAGGRNYGWRNREGAHDNIADPAPLAETPLTDPVFEYSHSEGKSIIGGFVYRGSALGASYAGRYFFGDYVTGRVWSLAFSIDEHHEAAAEDLREHTLELGANATLDPSSFGIDANGELYIVSHAGRVFKLINAAPDPPPGATTYTLTITKPTGGTILGPEIWCGDAGNRCQVTKPANTAIILFAISGDDQPLTSWGGCSAGFTLTADTTCAPTFSGSGGGSGGGGGGGGGTAFYTLIITKPTGGIIGGPDIWCGDASNTCAVTKAAGTTITLTAYPANGQSLTSWGGCSVRFSLTTSMTCAPTFSGTGGGGGSGGGSTSYTLTVTKPTGGTILGPEIWCGEDGNNCQVTKPAGTTISLTALAGTLTSWGGCTASFVLSANTTCAPTFSGSGGGSGGGGGGSASYTLTITKPTGGTILGPDLWCGTAGNVCQVSKPAGTTIELVALMGTLSSWGGCSASFALNANTTCAPTFGSGSGGGGSGGGGGGSGLFTLTLVNPSAGGGGGFILGPDMFCNPGGGALCAKTFSTSTPVSLTPVPYAGFTFSGWVEAGCANSMTISSTKTCTANFNRSP